MIIKQFKSSCFIYSFRSLQAGSSYSFTAIVYGGSLSGNASVNVTAVPTDLILTLSRSSGMIGVDRDFYISASATDPDNSTAMITILWNCSQGVAVCTANDNNLLFSPTYSPNLTISADRLADQALYTITALASTGKKSIKGSINILVNKYCTGEIAFSPITEVVNSQQSYLIAPSISAPGTNNTFF